MILNVVAALILRYLTKSGSFMGRLRQSVNSADAAWICKLKMSAEYRIGLPCSALSARAELVVNCDLHVQVPVMRWLSVIYSVSSHDPIQFAVACVVYKSDLLASLHEPCLAVRDRAPIGHDEDLCSCTGVQKIVPFLRPPSR